MRRRSALVTAVVSAVMLTTVGVLPAVAKTPQVTGEVVWVSTVGGGVVSAPTVGKDLVFAGTGEGKVTAVDPETGAIVWVTQLGDVSGPLGAVTTPTLGKGLLYTGTASGQLAAIG